MCLHFKSKRQENNFLVGFPRREKFLSLWLFDFPQTAPHNVNLNRIWIIPFQRKWLIKGGNINSIFCEDIKIQHEETLCFTRSYKFRVNKACKTLDLHNLGSTLLIQLIRDVFFGQFWKLIPENQWTGGLLSVFRALIYACKVPLWPYGKL